MLAIIAIPYIQQTSATYMKWKLVGDKDRRQQYWEKKSFILIIRIQWISIAFKYLREK